MKEKDMEKLTASIQEKIGKEASGLIADDLGKLITDNTLMNSELTKRDERITKLEKDKENLITTNGNLLQQVVMGKEEKEEPKPEENKPKIISYANLFDEKGNFKV